jgi:hypothetical protein
VIANKRPRWLFACGVAIGLASLIKHQAAILLTALTLAELWPSRRRPASVLLMLLGFALPWLAASGLYEAHGQLPAFSEWNLTRNLHYVARTFGSPLRRFLLGTVAYGFGAGPLLWLFACRRSRRIVAAGRIRAGLVLALWLTWIPVSLGGRFYNHYYLQFVPPLCLLAAAPATALWRTRRRLRRWQRRTALALVLLPVLTAQSIHLGRGLAGQYPSQDRRARAIADWLRTHTRPDERVVVYGHFTPVYQEAQRLPGTRYIHTSQLFGNVDAMQLPGDIDATRLRAPADEAAFVADLETRRAQWFVDTSPANIKNWSKLPLVALPSLARYVNEHYRKVGSPGGAAVYRRVSP